MSGVHRDLPALGLVAMRQFIDLASCSTDVSHQLFLAYPMPGEIVNCKPRLAAILAVYPSTQDASTVLTSTKTRDH